MLPDQRWTGRVSARAGRIRFGLPLLAVALCLASTAQTADSVDPRLAAEACAGCHGETRDEPAAIPGLATLSPAAIVEAMAAFRRGQRDNPVMWRIAQAYSVEEVAALAEVLGNGAGGGAGND